MELSKISVGSDYSYIQLSWLSEARHRRRVRAVYIDPTPLTDSMTLQVVFVLSSGDYVGVPFWVSAESIVEPWDEHQATLKQEQEREAELLAIAEDRLMARAADGARLMLALSDAGVADQLVSRYASEPRNYSDQAKAIDALINSGLDEKFIRETGASGAILLGPCAGEIVQYVTRGSYFQITFDDLIKLVDHNSTGGN